MSMDHWVALISWIDNENISLQIQSLWVALVCWMDRMMAESCSGLMNQSVVLNGWSEKTGSRKQSMHLWVGFEQQTDKGQTPAQRCSRFISESVSVDKQTQDRHRLRESVAAFLSRFRPKCHSRVNVKKTLLFNFSTNKRNKSNSVEFTLSIQKTQIYCIYVITHWKRLKLACALKIHHG